MDFPAAQKADNLVPGFLDAQASLHHFRMIFGNADRVFVAEKIRRVQHINVQSVAFDPFSAVEQAPQLRSGPSTLHSEGILDGVAGAHLIGDGANSADARRDVGHFGEFPATEKCFKEARRLEDLQLYVSHTLPLDFDD